LILGFHVIFAAYGFWLPNDPRGSWSTWIRQWELLRFGRATKVTTTRSVAHRGHDRALRLAAKEALMYRPVVFDGVQGREIGRGFGEAVESAGYKIWACTVLPEHVHLVLGRHQRPIQQIAAHLKSAANARLAEAKLHPFQDVLTPGGGGGVRVSPWGRRYWKVFLDSDEDIRRAVEYVRKNAEKEGYRRQRWRFETAYG
jgi:REP element-mobilizing transposase RayT